MKPLKVMGFEDNFRLLQDVLAALVLVQNALNGPGRIFQVKILILIWYGNDKMQIGLS